MNSYFIRLTINHSYKDDLLNDVLKLQPHIYFLGLHNNKQEHYHLYIEIDDDIERVRRRYNQPSFREKYNIKGLKNRVNVKKANKDELDKIIHYTIDGCMNDKLPYFTNISDEEIERITLLDYPNKYQKQEQNNKHKPTINNIATKITQETINKELLEKIYKEFTHNELYKIVLDKFIYELVENNISSKYQRISEILLTHIYIRLKQLREEDEENIYIHSYFDYYAIKIVNKISNLILY